MFPGRISEHKLWWESGTRRKMKNKKQIDIISNNRAFASPMQTQKRSFKESQCTVVRASHLISGNPRHGLGRAWAWGLNPRKMSLSPTMKQAGQESGCQLIPQSQILMVSAVKICKQCLQTAWGPPTGATP